VPSPLLVLDTLVGLSFVAVGLATRRAPAAMRAWWAAVGVAWWLGGVPELRVLHQGLLVVALVAFSAGRLSWPAGMAFGAIAVLVGVGAGGQPVAAASLALVALVGSRDGFPRVAAGLVSAVLAGLWVWSRVRLESFLPLPALVGYEMTLLLVAAGLPVGLAWRDRTVARMRDRLLESGPVGLPGLEHALRNSLVRPGLALVRTDDGVRLNGTGRLDPSTRAAVERAVELTLEHERAKEALVSLVRDLEQARVRLLAAADWERDVAARGLRADLRSLHRAAAAASGHPLLAEELRGAAAEIEAIVVGLPPVPLGYGQLPAALRDLCARHRGPVSVALDEVEGTPAAETTLFFVCSEALANSAKHAGTATVDVRLTAEGNDLVLVVQDDGVGGADPAGGSGLTGLADRLATYGGLLTVTGPSGTGTRIEARVSRSAGTA